MPSAASPTTSKPSASRRARAWTRKPAWSSTMRIVVMGGSWHERPRDALRVNPASEAPWCEAPVARSTSCGHPTRDVALQQVVAEGEDEEDGAELQEDPGRGDGHRLRLRHAHQAERMRRDVEDDAGPDGVARAFEEERERERRGHGQQGGKHRDHERVAREQEEVDGPEDHHRHEARATETSGRPAAGGRRRSRGTASPRPARSARSRRAGPRASRTAGQVAFP